MDRALAELPIIQEVGGSVKTEVLPVYDYRTYAGDLKEAAHG